MRSCLIYFSIFAAVLFAGSCSMNNPEKRIEKLIAQYRDKHISNYQMLMGLGELYLVHPENTKVKSEYFNRMIISGYSSWAIHYYLAEPGRLKVAEDERIILFALRKGNHYNLANAFTAYFSDEFLGRLQEIIELGDSLSYHNYMVATTRSPESFAGRSNFLTALGEADMATIDLAKSLRADPCNHDALFQRSMALFDAENTKEIIKVISRCPETSAHSDHAWKPVFLQLARDVESVLSSDSTEKEKLFRLANLYVNNGFADIALRKSNRLIQLEHENADYLALHAFVYYRIGDKRNAIRYLNDAENISGRTSRLRELIEQLD